MTEKNLWITGAGTGMGRAVAERAAASGWSVGLTGRRREPLEEVAAAVRSVGGRAVVAAADAGSHEQLREARDAVESALGPVTGLVTAAGLNSPRRLWSDQTMDEFRAIVATNLEAVAFAIDLALPSLRRGGGPVVVISSYSGWHASPKGGVAYSAAKTGLTALCETLNTQEEEHGVRACHFCPGDVDTPFLRMRTEVPDAAARAKMLTPGDIAEAVQFVLDRPAHVRIDELVISPVVRG